MRYLWRSALVTVVMVASVAATPVAMSAVEPMPATWDRASTTPAAAPGSACAARDEGRFADCRSGPFSWVMREANGEEIGSVDLAFTISERLEPGRRDWVAHYTVVIERLEGAAEVGTTAAVVAECQGSCSAGTGLADNGTQLVENQVLSGDVSFSSGGTGISSSEQSIAVYLFNPAAVGTGTTRDDETSVGGPRRSTLGPVRCDSATTAEGLGALGRPGCVMSDVIPTLNLEDPQWSQIPTPAHNDFVRRAQADPRTVEIGKPGAGNPMIREKLSKREKARKRAMVCGRFVRADEKDSCDEYPYSASRQGVPLYAVTESVPEEENYAAGNKLGQFFAVNHVLDGDGFYVQP